MAKCLYCDRDAEYWQSHNSDGQPVVSDIMVCRKHAESFARQDLGLSMSCLGVAVIFAIIAFLAMVVYLCW